MGHTLSDRSGVNTWQNWDNQLSSHIFRLGTKRFSSLWDGLKCGEIYKLRSCGMALSATWTEKKGKLGGTEKSTSMKDERHRGTARVLQLLNPCSCLFTALGFPSLGFQRHSFIIIIIFSFSLKLIVSSFLLPATTELNIQYYSLWTVTVVKHWSFSPQTLVREPGRCLLDDWWLNEWK